MTEPATRSGRRPQDLVMTLLGAYVRDRSRHVWSGGLVALLGELGFSAGAARIALGRLVNRDVLRPDHHGRLVLYELTSHGRELVAEGERRIAALLRAGGPADAWTLLWHQLPDDRRIERGRLARRLRSWGFGSVQGSIWLAPHDRERAVAELIRALDIAPETGVLLFRPAASLPANALIAQAWDLPDLSVRYREFTELFGPHLDAPPSDPPEAFLVRTRLVHGFRQFAELDPELPDDVLPAPERRAEAAALVQELAAALAEPAQRHFDEVVRAQRTEALIAGD